MADLLKLGDCFIHAVAFLSDKDFPPVFNTSKQVRLALNLQRHMRVLRSVYCNRIRNNWLTVRERLVFPQPYSHYDKYLVREDYHKLEWALREAHRIPIVDTKLVDWAVAYRL